MSTFKMIGSSLLIPTNRVPRKCKYLGLWVFRVAGVEIQFNGYVI